MTKNLWDYKMDGYQQAQAFTTNTACWVVAQFLTFCWPWNEFGMVGWDATYIGCHRKYICLGWLADSLVCFGWPMWFVSRFLDGAIKHLSRVVLSWSCIAYLEDSAADIYFQQLLIFSSYAVLPDTWESLQSGGVSVGFLRVEAVLLILGTAVVAWEPQLSLVRRQPEAPGACPAFPLCLGRRYWATGSFSSQSCAWITAGIGLDISLDSKIGHQI